MSEFDLPRFKISLLTNDDGGGYLITFPDFPGCMADGDTPEDALVEGRDALKSFKLTLAELGRKVPEAGAAFAGQWR